MWFVHNSQFSFYSLPFRFRDLFQYERLEPYLHMKTGYEQLFVGREGTGTPFHNAANWNMFYMVSLFLFAPKYLTPSPIRTMSNLRSCNQLSHTLFNISLSYFICPHID